jgi:hypothetical protein
MASYKRIYNYRDDNRRTLFNHIPFANSSAEFGAKTADGLNPGTTEWLTAIDDGTIATHKVTGIITRVYVSGHNDYTEFEIDSEGKKTTWPREGDITRYIVGQQIIITYAEQRLRNGQLCRHILQIEISTN